MSIILVVTGLDGFLEVFDLDGSPGLDLESSMQVLHRGGQFQSLQIGELRP